MRVAAPASAAGGDRVQRWTPWLLGLIAAVAYAAIAPRGGGIDVPVWGVLARLAEAFPIGDVADRAHALGAVCAGVAAVLVARLAIGFGGGDAAAIAGSVASAVVLGAAGAWSHPTVAGASALVSVLALAAIALADRVVAGGGAWPGVTAGVAVGLAAAMDPCALALAPVVVALLAVRVKHGARWPLVAPLAGALAWLIAMIPVWRTGVVTTGLGPRSLVELADSVGAIAGVAAAAGVIALLVRRRTRWPALLILSLVAGGVALEHLGTARLGVLPVVGLALAASAGVGRLARLVDLPAGQACLGATATLLVALPTALWSA